VIGQGHGLWIHHDAVCKPKQAQSTIRKASPKSWPFRLPVIILQQEYRYRYKPFVETSRPVYGKTKRLRRRLLKTFDRWPRQDYDVRLIHVNGKPAFKQVIFKTSANAQQVSNRLQRYGATPHLPAWRGCRGNAVWVDFIAGTTCHRIDESMLPQLAECFAQFAGHASYLERLDRTFYRQLYRENLDYLSQHGVLCPSLHRALDARAAAVAPARVRIGFDYTDPIGANLVQRERCGRICAVDIKNLYADTLVGQGLAKASNRWFSPERQAHIFAHLETLGLGDILQAFAFLLLFEAAERIRRKTRSEVNTYGSARAVKTKKAQLAALLP
jgi:hypothetical protein